MPQPSRTSWLYVCLAGLALLAGFLAVRTYHLQRQLAAMQAEQAARSDRAQARLQGLAAADSLLLAGEIDQARAAYTRLRQQPGQELNQLVQRRMRQVDRWQQMKRQLDQYAGQGPDRALAEQVQAQRQQLDSLRAQADAAQRRQTHQVDSMRFALEKAQMRNEVLEQQVATLADERYLTFANEQGETVHYVGEVKDQQAHGWGVGLSESGIRYEGEWQANRHHGQGTLHWPDQEYYQGHFRAGERHGSGSYHWPDGKMFAGTWRADQRNGPGVFYDAEGNIMAQGIWRNNELVKKQ